MTDILLLNGPNLNMLGVRDPQLYGEKTLAEVEDEVRAHGTRLGVSVACRQSNAEGELIDLIHAARGTFAGIVYNPGAHAHYSYALADAIEAAGVSTVEVHITDTAAREDFRRVDVIAPVCVGAVVGHGTQGYLEALDLLLEHLR